MASYKELAEKYGSRLKEACALAEHTPGRRRIAQMLTEWSGERVTQHAARKLMKYLNLAKGEHTGRIKSLNRIDDVAETPLDRTLASRGRSIQTLQQLLAAAGMQAQQAQQGPQPSQGGRQGPPNVNGNVISSQMQGFTRVGDPRQAPPGTPGGPGPRVNPMESI